MLIGRERELQQLKRVMASARSGTAAVLALVGEPGIGKTSLLEYPAEHAVGLWVLRAANSPSGISRRYESDSRISYAAPRLSDAPTAGQGVIIALLAAALVGASLRVRRRITT